MTLNVPDKKARVEYGPQETVNLDLDQMSCSETIPKFAPKPSHGVSPFSVVIG